METKRKFIRIIVMMIAFFASSAKANANEFALPLKDCGPNLLCYINAYVNHGNANSPEQDWNNGTRTYRSWSDTYHTWYYHKGTDIGTGGFDYVMVNGRPEARLKPNGRIIIAAKEGIVTEVVRNCEVDTCEGGCCLCTANDPITGNGLGNYMKICRVLNDGRPDINHCELYGHMQTGSARVAVGDIVTCHQELGTVGSSGCSRGPHLHFQPEVNGVRVDPFHGPSNARPSMWVEQNDYDAVAGWSYEANHLPGTRCSEPPPPNCTAPASPPLIPSSGATNISRKTSFSWNATLCGNVMADVYRIQVHTSPNFPPECNADQPRCSELITLNDGTAAARYPALLNNLLAYSTKYYWRVRGGHTLGAGGDWSNTWNFTTETDPQNNPPQCDPIPEICDNKDNNCNKQIDENLTASCQAACGNGTKICVAGTWSNCAGPGKNSCGVCNNTRSCNNGCGGMGIEDCSNGQWINCTAPAPKAEICNNADDDCNGKIDDNVTASCSILPCNNLGTKTCTAGQWGSCIGNPCGQVCTPEICDGKDNNCNNQTDENLIQACQGACGAGNQICVNGSWSACTNGKNSCNSCSSTRACSSQCGMGIEDCIGGQWLNCTAPACNPMPEVCNNVDDDFNGKVDDGLTRTCTTLCETGTSTCVNGAWVNCTARLPVAETCNNIDDDCDGVIDDNLSQNCVGACGNGTQTCNAGLWGACSAAGLNSCGSCGNTRPCNTTCGAGTETCQNGAWVNCSAPTPKAETCNNIDDDCDGSIDEGLQMACGGACGNGTQTCVGGNWSPCNAPGANSCGTCSNTRSCQNACGNQGIETCQNGMWINCSAAACPIPLTAPILISPANDFIKQVSEGNAGSQSVSCSSVNGAVRYNYLVRVYSTAPIGSIYEQGSTAGTSHVVGFDPNKQYGMGMEWLVQAVDANNNTGPWSTPRHFYFSHPTGSLIYCNDGNCEKPGTVYKVMGQFRSPDIQGAPWRIVLEWVSGNCLNGRATTLVAGTHLSSLTYYKSAAAGGCP